MDEPLAVYGFGSDPHNDELPHGDIFGPYAADDEDVCRSVCCCTAGDRQTSRTSSTKTTCARCSMRGIS